MLVFRLDECINSRALASGCNDAGIARVRRFPAALRGQGVKDPEVLERLLGGDEILLTTDWALIDEHSRCIPDDNPGIVVVNNTPAEVRTLTQRLVTQILGEFKSGMPEWGGLSVRNSVVRITQECVEVLHVESGRVVRDAYLPFIEGGWAARLSEVLGRNAAR